MNRTVEFKLLGRGAALLAHPVDINVVNVKVHKLFPRPQLRYKKTEQQLTILLTV